MRHTRLYQGSIAAGAALTLMATATTAGAVAPVGSGPVTLPPSYSVGDITGDGRIDTHDLEKLARNLGATTTSPGWPAVAPADLDGDGVLTVGDLAALSQQIIYDDGTFKLVEASALEMQAAMNAGVVTSVQLTQAYLDRIATYDRGAQPLNSIITTSSVALAAAAESDAARKANGGPRSLLDGIPIVLKDNYNTVDMPTTAGCSCWELNQTDDDAAMVEGLRDAHAIVLAKASMDEFAINLSSSFSAGTPAGQQLNVYSPYRPGPSGNSTSGGSSGGSGASIAANLAAIGFGTDTGGSIRVPSTYNQLVGLRPTVGLTSRDGIVPLALSQDVGGPMAKSVADVAIALDAVAGSDPADPVTAPADAAVPTTYAAYLGQERLDGVKVGWDPAMVNTTNPTVLRTFAQARADLEALGAEVVQISIPQLSAILGEPSGSTNEFNHDLDEYVASYLAPEVPYRSLTEIAATNPPEYVSGRGAPNGTYASRGRVTQEGYEAWMSTHVPALASFRATVTGLMDSLDLDAIVFPGAGPFTTVGLNGRFSPNTGLPALTVPMGVAVAPESFAGVGSANIEMVGRAFAEPTLISIGDAYEQATMHRTTPTLFPALPGDTFTGPGTDLDPAGTGAYTVTTSAGTVKKGDTFTVTVAQDAADLFAYTVSVGYDPKAFKLVSATVDGRGVTDSRDKAGTATVVNTKLGTSSGSEGSTVLVTYTFSAAKAGSTSGITLTDLDTVDSSGTLVSIV